MLGNLSRQAFGVFIAFNLCLCVSAVEVLSQGLPAAKPAAAGMEAAKLDRIGELVLSDIAEKKLPGAVVLVGRKGKIIYRRAFGDRSLAPAIEPMTVDTIFDVASLTKPVATATSIMILIEQGKLQLNDTVGKFIHDIEDEQFKGVTVKQLLTHTSGLKPSFDLSQKWTGRDGMLAALRKERLRDQPGTKFVYSDIGFMTLGEIVFSLTGTEVDKFAAQNIFEPLAMNDSLFLRFPRSGLQGSLFRIAPTENIRGQNSYLGSKFEGDADTGNKILRGAVHDPTAFRMGGAAGHAGLFSTADDLARYCQMILNGGVYGGRRILSAQTIALMTRPYVVSETGATRGLGWDMNTTFSRNRGELFPLGSFGHTGFTGTSIWIDPTSGTFVVFLSNRVHPDGKGDVGDLRARVAGVVASAITDVPVEKWREAEARYYAAVNAQIAAFPKTPPPK